MQNFYLSMLQFYRGYRKTFRGKWFFIKKWIFKLPQSQDMVEEKKLALPF